MKPQTLRAWAIVDTIDDPPELCQHMRYLRLWKSPRPDVMLLPGQRLECVEVVVRPIKRKAGK